VKRAKHNLSNYKLATCDMGQLIPCGLVEVIRGDSIRQHTSALVRMSAMLAPVMHPVHTKIHHWFVPHRLSWTDWENFITGGPDGNNNSTHPTITLAGGAAVGSLADYFGIPTGVNNITFNALPFRAYARIWNEFYRDQDLQTALALSTASGADSTTNTTLQNAAWNKDYFTTARPEPQKGADVVLPLGTSAPIERVSNASGVSLLIHNSNTQAPNSGIQANSSGFLAADSSGQRLSIEPNGSLYADLEGATSASVQDVRLAMALQRFKEARSKFGSKYVDFLAYYGIKSSDARLQRPEYLGGGSQTIQFSEVLQTAPNSTDGDSELDGVGDLYGHGIGSVKSNAYQRFFEEDGYIISLMVTNPITMYVQGLPRTWNRRLKEDYFQKELQHIGQMAVPYKEVYAAHSTPDETFGWQDRYDDYRRIENTIAGEFRTTLNYWHLARIFASDPSLNGDFVKSNPSNRIFADQTVNQLQIMIRHSIHARRLVSKYGTSFIS